MDAAGDLSSLAPCLDGSRRTRGVSQSSALAAGLLNGFPNDTEIGGAHPQHRFARDRELSRVGAEEKDLGVLMDEKSGMCKSQAAYELPNAEERLDIKIS